MVDNEDAHTEGPVDDLSERDARRRGKYLKPFRQSRGKRWLKSRAARRWVRRSVTPSRARYVQPYRTVIPDTPSSSDADRLTMTDLNGFQ
jgi:hypothetical protein